MIDLADGARVERGNTYTLRFTAPRYNSETSPSVANPDGGGIRPTSRAQLPISIYTPRLRRGQLRHGQIRDGGRPVSPEIATGAEFPMSFLISACDRVQISSLDAILSAKEPRRSNSARRSGGSFAQICRLLASTRKRKVATHSPLERDPNARRIAGT